MRLQVWCETDVGLKRSNNQDSFLIDEGLGLYVVADGMGGHKGGEVASQMAVETAREVFEEKKNLLEPESLLHEIYQEANRRIFAKSNDNPELKGMGTTMVLCYVMRGTMYIGNVGDSRAYFLTSDGRFWQLTEDHSLVNEQIRSGTLDPENMDEFVGKNIITRSVGYEPSVVCDIYKRRLSAGEKYLFCSDGLTGMVADPEVARIIGEPGVDVKDGVRTCIEKAKENGGDDNITVLILQVKES